jgi:hypothetical protein
MEHPDHKSIISITVLTDIFSHMLEGCQQELLGYVSYTI